MCGQSKLRSFGPAHHSTREAHGKRQETTLRNCRSVSLAPNGIAAMMTATNYQTEFAQLAYAEGVIYER